MTLHKFNVGDPTYVVSHDSEDRIRVYVRKVTRVSAKQLHVEGVPGGRVIHRPIASLSKFHKGEDAWSPIVFATAEAALTSYIDQRHTELDRARRRIERSNKLIDEACALLHKQRLDAARAAENTDDDPVWPDKSDGKPYRNEIACVGITTWKGRDPKGCGSGHRYSVGPIPKVADINKSPRCSNCGGLVIEIGGPL